MKSRSSPLSGLVGKVMPPEPRARPRPDYRGSPGGGFLEPGGAAFLDRPWPFSDRGWPFSERAGHCALVLLAALFFLAGAFSPEDPAGVTGGSSSAFKDASNNKSLIGYSDTSSSSPLAYSDTSRGGGLGGGFLGEGAPTASVPLDDEDGKGVPVVERGSTTEQQSLGGAKVEEEGGKRREEDGEEGGSKGAEDGKGDTEELKKASEEKADAEEEKVEGEGKEKGGGGKSGEQPAPDGEAAETGVEASSSSPAGVVPDPTAGIVNTRVDNPSSEADSAVSDAAAGDTDAAASSAEEDGMRDESSTAAAAAEDGAGDKTGSRSAAAEGGEGSSEGEAGEKPASSEPEAEAKREEGAAGSDTSSSSGGKSSTAEGGDDSSSSPREGDTEDAGSDSDTASSKSGSREGSEGESEGEGGQVEPYSCEGRRVYVLDMGEDFHRGFFAGPTGNDPRHHKMSELNGGFGPSRDGDQGFAGGEGEGGGEGRRGRGTKGRRRGKKGSSGMLRGEERGKSEEGEGSGVEGRSVREEQGEGEGEEEREGEFPGSFSSSSSSPPPSSSVSSSPSATWPDLHSTWYDTWANALDIVFHSRMLAYPCRVYQTKEADLFYVPYYGSLDISTHLGGSLEERGRVGQELNDKILKTKAYRRHQGRDHFVVVGRPYWDFISNFSEPRVTWGSNSLRQEVFDKARIVTVERPYWVENTLGAPYPMAFHPRGKKELQEWVDFAKGHERPSLFAFAGARRRSSSAHKVDAAVKARDSVFWQCERAVGKCKLVDCDNPPGACERDWHVFMNLYLSSTFCIHPRGDSCTRRAVLDSMLAGCIPVLLEKCTADWQYQWLLGDTDEYSVFFDRKRLRGEEGGEGELLEDVLSSIPLEKVERMRKRIYELIPNITFGGHFNGSAIEPPDFEDAFNAIVTHVAHDVKQSLEKVA